MECSLLTTPSVIHQSTVTLQMTRAQADEITGNYCTVINPLRQSHNTPTFQMEIFVIQYL